MRYWSLSGPLLPPAYQVIILTSVVLAPRADRAERDENAELQDLHRKEQLQMLESILRRVICLEAREKATTQGEMNSSDPPAESTD